MTVLIDVFTRKGDLWSEDSMGSFAGQRPVYVRNPSWAGSRAWALDLSPSSCLAAVFFPVIELPVGLAPANTSAGPMGGPVESCLLGAQPKSLATLRPATAVAAAYAWLTANLGLCLNFAKLKVQNGWHNLTLKKAILRGLSPPQSGYPIGPRIDDREHDLLQLGCFESEVEDEDEEQGEGTGRGGTLKLKIIKPQQQQANLISRVNLSAKKVKQSDGHHVELGNPHFTTLDLTAADTLNPICFPGLFRMPKHVREKKRIE
ncbi:hypothetical protein BY996DRAFT_6412795 [Phakopsora pachyrhizi]|nr:hypothetical protein BY996DRAFT_6412795 [Phakopsora pachyrhizi]